MNTSYNRIESYYCTIVIAFSSDTVNVIVNIIGSVIVIVNFMGTVFVSTSVYNLNLKSCAIDFFNFMYFSHL